MSWGSNSNRYCCRIQSKGAGCQCGKGGDPRFGSRLPRRPGRGQVLEMRLGQANIVGAAQADDPDALGNRALNPCALLIALFPQLAIAPLG